MRPTGDPQDHAGWTAVAGVTGRRPWRRRARERAGPGAGNCDGSEGLSPDGWLPDRISVGVLTRVFTPELVDAAVADAGAREQRRRLLPARLMMYFVLALWLFRGRNCGYGQVMTKLADGLYQQRRSWALLAGQQLDPGGWLDTGQ